MNRKFCYLWLSANKDDAQKIANTLLNQRLIVCAKFMPAESIYWWQGEITQDNEVVIVMETAEDLFNAIETEVAKLHSYDTFVLQCIPVSRINDKAMAWMNNELRKLA